MRPPLLLCLCLLGVSICQGQAPAEFEGKNVVRIDWEPAEQPLPIEELQRRIKPLATGGVLTSAAIHEAIQALNDTGRYHDVSVEAQPEGDGVAVKIVTEFNYFVARVSIQGEAEPPNREQLRTAAKLELGTGFFDNQMEQAVENMQERFRANGLYGAKVTYRVTRAPATEEASIYFDIHSGDRARFDGVNVTGTFFRPAQSVIRTTGWRRGFLFLTLPGWRDVTEARLQNGRSQVQKSFQTGDRLGTKVALGDPIFHQETNRVTASLDIQAGPIVEVAIAGKAKFAGVNLSNSRLHQLVPIYEERTVDSALLDEGRRNIGEYLQSRRYFEAQVDTPMQDELGPGHTVVTYSVQPGMRSKLVNVSFIGNHYFNTSTLRERLYMMPARFPSNMGGRYSDRILEQDKQALVELYRSNGFRDAKIVSTKDHEYRGKQGSLSVTLEVQEGTQWFVNKLEVVGASAEDEKQLRASLQSTMGEPFSETNISADRESVLSYYYNNGYPDATFDWSQTPVASANQVHLQFIIRPGKRQFVRGVLVRGLETTNPKLVENRISLRGGDPISQSQISESQQKLYDLGIFSKVQTALQNPDGEEDSKYVLFHLDEASKYSFNAAFGAQLARIGGGITTFDNPAGTTGFSPRASIGISRLNFLGLGHTIGLQTLVSTLEQRAVLSYIAPQFTGHQNLSLTFSGLFDDSNDIRTFTSHRVEGSVQLAQRVSRASTVQYRYVFRRVTVPLDTLKISSPELIPLLSQPDRAGLVAVSFIQDKRDNPTDSRRGMLNTVDLAYAFKGFGSETDYTRLVLHNTSYHRIGRDMVLARSTQFGYIQRLGGVPEIPLAERFFSGGASTNRAFPDNQAGPRDPETGFPLGGSAFLFNSTELRFPLIGDNVGGVLFHDMGNVYSDISHLSLRYHQRNIQDFNYAVHSIGFGIRYKTPVGPIRVDFSYSPNSPRFFGFSGTRDQLLAGTCTLVNQRISAFQFQFSLGQTF